MKLVGLHVTSCHFESRESHSFMALWDMIQDPNLLICHLSRLYRCLNSTEKWTHLQWTVQSRLRKAPQDHLGPWNIIKNETFVSWNDHIWQLGPSIHSWVLLIGIHQLPIWKWTWCFASVRSLFGGMELALRGSLPSYGNPSLQKSIAESLRNDCRIARVSW